jgi:hypothetical protein
VAYKNHAAGQTMRDSAKKKGAAYFAAFKRRYDGDPNFKLAYDGARPLVEVEFDIPIPRSPHSIVGRMDEVIEWDGRLWVGDTKTANEKSTEAKKRVEFGFSMQPIFYINAARLLGYAVRGMLYRVVTAHVPAKHWVIPSTRTEYQLALGLRNIHMTCELIEFYRREFGTEEPWPHIATSYPCNYIPAGSDKIVCEYRDICQRPSYELTEDDLDDFVPRLEHLNLLRGKK